MHNHRAQRNQTLLLLGFVFCVANAKEFSRQSLTAVTIAAWEAELACAPIGEHILPMNQRIADGATQQALCEQIHSAKSALFHHTSTITSDRPVVGGETRVPLWISVTNIAILSVVQRHFRIGAAAGAARAVAMPLLAARRSTAGCI